MVSEGIGRCNAVAEVSLDIDLPRGYLGCLDFAARTGMLRDRYEFRDRIASDGMGEVWMALAHEPPRLVRLRRATGEVWGDSALAEAWLFEVRRAARVRQSSLPELFEWGLDEENGRPFVAGEWTDGANLAARLRDDRRLPPAEALRIAAEVAGALDAAWSAERLLHGFLTPDTVHLWPEGRVSVLDLGATGVTALLRADRVSDLLRLLRGAPHWTAPELARASSATDCRADMYSLGAVLYQCTTGTPPFGDAPAAEALDKHLLGFLDDPCDLVPALPPQVAWLLERLMARDPEKRFPDWVAARAAIEAVAGGAPPPGNRLPPGESVIQRGAKRDPALAEARWKPATHGRGGRRRLRTGRRNGLAIHPPPTAAVASQPVQTTSRGGRVILIALLLAAAGAYGLKEMSRREKVDPAPSSIEPRPSLPTVLPSGPPNSAVGSEIQLEEILGLRPKPAPSASTPASSESAVSGDDAPAALAEPAAAKPVQDPLRNHPPFHQAAELFNESLRLFREFQQNGNVDLLDRVETLAEEAGRQFEHIRPAFPNDARLAKFIEQCYGMVRYARQSRLSSGRLTGGGSRPRPPRETFRPALPPPPSSIGPPASPPRQEGPGPAFPSGLTPSSRRLMHLPPDWNALSESAPPQPVNCARLCAVVRHCAGVWRTAEVSGRLTGGIAYLAPLDEAVRQLGIDPPGGTGTDVTFPGFSIARCGTPCSNPRRPTCRSARDDC